MKITKPTITQVTNAPAGSTLEVWHNRNVETPHVWIKLDDRLWRNTSVIGALTQPNNGMTLSRHYRVILTVKENA